MFSVQVAAAIFQTKVNFDLTFPARPTLAQLKRVTEDSFSNEISIRRPEGTPPHPFRVAKFKIYDESHSKWSDLLVESQLGDYCQCYAFQPENPWHKESPKEIPAPVKPPQGAAGGMVNGEETRLLNSVSPNAVDGGAVIASSISFPKNVTPNGRYSVMRSIGGGGGVGGGVSVQSISGSAGTTTTTNNRYNNTSLQRTKMGGESTTGYGALSSPSRPSADASNEEKIRVVFREFDLKGHHMLDIEDLQNGFHDLGFELTTATMNDLFQKGDTNSDGRISYTDFERFASLYPIMMDCLFFRSKAFWDEDAMQREAETAADAARAAAAWAEEVERSKDAVAREVEGALRDIEEADRAIQDLNGRLRDLATEAETAQREKERAQKDKRDSDGECIAARERERANRQLYTEFVKESERYERKVEAAGNAFNKADDRVKELQRQLLEAQRIAEQTQSVLQQAEDEAQVFISRGRDVALQHDQDVREVARCEDALHASDEAIRLANSHIRDLDGYANALSREADDGARRREGCERTFAQTKASAARVDANVERARREADEQDRIAQEKAAEAKEAKRQRQCVSTHERALIEEELRLREQRESLEEKEAKLKNVAGSYIANLRHSVQKVGGAGSQPRMRSQYSKTSSAGGGGYGR